MQLYKETIKENTVIGAYTDLMGEGRVVSGGVRLAQVDRACWVPVVSHQSH